MDPLILYALLALGGLRAVRRRLRHLEGASGRCPGCDADVDIHARGCRFCGYRFGRT